MDPSLLSPPLSASTVGSRRNKFFMPLSASGMPKEPRPVSPGSIRSDRFGNLHSPRFSRSTSITSPPMTPMSFQSPPLSARSFGTMIDSAPSTPSFSPRATSSQWDSSALILLSPVPSTTASSPPEPAWDMVTPVPNSPKHLRKASSSSGLGIHINPSTLASHPAKSQRENGNLPPASEDTNSDPEAERKAEEDKAAHEDTLGKIATRVKLMLRRKSGGERRAEKRRRREEMDYVRAEDVHWSEY